MPEQKCHEPCTPSCGIVAPQNSETGICDTCYDLLCTLCAAFGLFIPARAACRGRPAGSYKSRRATLSLTMTTLAPTVANWLLTVANWLLTVANGYSPWLNGNSLWLISYSPGLIAYSPWLTGYSLWRTGYSPWPIGYSPWLIGYSPWLNGYSPWLYCYSPWLNSYSLGLISYSPGLIAYSRGLFYYKLGPLDTQSSDSVDHRGYSVQSTPTSNFARISKLLLVLHMGLGNKPYPSWLPFHVPTPSVPIPPHHFVFPINSVRASLVVPLKGVLI